MATDTNVNLYAAGTFSGNIDFDFNNLEGVPNETSAFIVKHANDGTVLASIRMLPEIFSLPDFSTIRYDLKEQAQFWNQLLQAPEIAI